MSQMPIEYNLKTKRIPWVMYSILAANIAIFVSYFFGPIDESFVYDNLEDVLGRSQFVLIYTRDHWKCLFQSLGRIRVQGMIFN